MVKLNEALKTKLLGRLKQLEKKNLAGFNVVLLPDFFVDHFLTMDEFEISFNRIKDIHLQGGGNLPGVTQKIHQGGNAANTALALATLGVKSHLICRTDEFGLHLLKYFLGANGVDLSGVKTDGKLAITTAMEFGEKHTNVMIGDTGSVSDFSFDSLNEKDLDAISNSDMTCLLNWTLNKNGTELARKTFGFAKENNVKTFFDTGDPSSRKNEISELIKRVLADKNLDILGLNENELLHYSNIKTSSDEDVVNAAVSLRQKINARLDLHTANFACTVDKKYTIIPTLKLSKIYRSTGAGDAWNAGDIFAELLDFDDDERLMFANSVAGYYISSSEPVHPTLGKIIEFISKL
ncbi:MAG: carbohydrate kinase family protein [Euryarchaeota archaeon]|nr:carbohydrate kinase family protein [Euryarchaeota archaeon]